MRIAANSMGLDGPKSPLAPADGTAQSGSALERRSFTRPAAGQRCRAYWSSGWTSTRSEEHTSELQSLAYLVCRLLLEKKKNKNVTQDHSCVVIVPYNWHRGTSGRVAS